MDRQESEQRGKEEEERGTCRQGYKEEWTGGVTKNYTQTDREGNVILRQIGNGQVERKKASRGQTTGKLWTGGDNRSRG